MTLEEKIEELEIYNKIYDEEIEKEAEIAYNKCYVEEKIEIKAEIEYNKLFEKLEIFVIDYEDFIKEYKEAYHEGFIEGYKKARYKQRAKTIINLIKNKISFDTLKLVINSITKEEYDKYVDLVNNKNI